MTALLLLSVTTLAARAADRPEPLLEEAAHSPAQQAVGGASAHDLAWLETEGRAWLEQPYMTGNWAGWRPALVRRGVTLAATYATDILGNPVGGVRQGVRYDQDIFVDLQLDLERLLSIPGARLEASMSSRAGASLSDEDIGNVFNVSQLCCEFQTRLVTLAWEQTLLEHRLAFRIGHLCTGDDFAASPLYNLFVTSGINANPASLSFNVPFFEYPDASIGALVELRPVESAYVKAGAYEGSEDGTGKHGVSFGDLSGAALLLAEAGYEAGLRVSDGVALPGHYAVGGYYHTGRFRRFDAPAGSDLPGDAEHGSSGVYFLLDQTLYRPRGGEDGQGLTPFVALVFAPNPEIAEFPFFFDAGLVYQGPLSSRPDDYALFGIVYGSFSSDLRAAQKGSPQGQQDFEMVLEWSYVVQVGPWLQLQPDFQYVIKPGGTGKIPDAFVLGTQVAVSF